MKSIPFLLMALMLPLVGCGKSVEATRQAELVEWTARYKTLLGQVAGFEKNHEPKEAVKLLEAFQDDVRLDAFWADELIREIAEEIQRLKKLEKALVKFEGHPMYTSERDTLIAERERLKQRDEKRAAGRKAPAPSITANVTYSIVDSHVVPGIKRSLDVRLNKRLSEETLRALALKLKSQDSRSYERTFICYYLPDMKVNAGAWATTHFNPGLEVRILGLTAKQEEALKQQPDDPSREVIGSWIDDRMYVGNRTTIFRQGGRVFMENTYKDGSSGKKEIVAKPSTSGKKFEDKGSRSTKKEPDTAAQRFLKVKLRELDRFKSKPEFSRFGFGRGGPFNSWLTDVESKRDSPGFSFVARVAVGDLQMLGLEYVATHGKENEYTKFASRQIRDVIRDENSASDPREFYLIDSQGNLQLCDKDGLISTAKKIGG